MGLSGPVPIVRACHAVRAVQPELVRVVRAVQPEVVWVVRAVGACRGLSRLSGPVRLSWLWQGGAEAGLVGRAGGGRR